ncbi:carboxypeptidase regulatory-like domain-containing protein [Myxococcus sp. CA051A]|uniref:carboxypeptidase-like regulatory domain-containing protein n=1 Tax=Myxococcus sp. CA051A TaxID=2741739 RepID=UPI00157AF87B|nr:carboxypeptidase-like regulatory domain-containing protein [Myxococcus sp. CA051A]NTX63166.1 carboxypeptidase regulatory-like domain-containing protein [Myxococcus sp. CA051A]
MRGWKWGSVIAGVLALLAWWMLGSTEPLAPAREVAPAPRRASGDSLPRTSAPTRAEQAGAGLSIRGTVVDSLGRPVAGARVSASWPEAGETLSELPCPEEVLPYWEALVDASQGRRKLPWCLPQVEDTLTALLLARQGEAPIHAETVSGDDGAFVLEGLPEGPQALLALSERGTALRPAVPSGSQDVELLLEPPWFVTGQVHGDGEPLAGVAVTAVSMHHTRFFDTSTDDQGRFRLGPLPRQSYQVLATKEGWLPTLAPERYSDQFREVTLYRPRALHGRVLSDGAPVPGVEVRAARADLDDGAPVPRTKTDAEGRFTLELSTGRYALTVEQGGRYAFARVVLGSAPPPEVVLKLGEALQVEGTVFDDAHGAVEGARVKAHFRQGGRESLEAVTAANGHYRLGPVEPGPWEFTVEAKGHVDLTVGQEHELASGMGPRDFTLKRTQTITGRVVDGAGQPISGVPLAMELMGTEGPEDYEPQELTFSDRDGRFVMDATRAGGSYEITARSDDYVHETVVATAPGPEVTLTLRAGATVEGTLTDARGLPVARFMVNVLPLDHDDEQERLLETEGTDDQGHFRRKGIYPGRYRVEAKQWASSVDRRVWADVELLPDTVTKVELRLQEEHSLEGIAVDTAGQPVQGLSVRAQSLARVDGPKFIEIHGDRHERPRGVLTDAEGRFVLRGLGPLDHALFAIKPGHELLPERCSGIVRDSEGVHFTADTKQVRLVFRRHPHIRGRLLGPDGAPQHSFTVGHTRVQSEDGTFAVPLHEEPITRQYLFSVYEMPTATRAVKGGVDVADVDLGDIRLEEGRYIQGLVLDAETGAPVKGATVELDAEPDEDGERGQLAGARTNSDGEFYLDKVASGPHTLRMSHPGNYRELLVPVAATQEKVTARMESGARVKVTARDRQGRPLDAFISYQGAGDEGLVEMGKGVSTLRGLEPGRYALKLIARHRNESLPDFQPLSVDLPERGALTVAFLPATGGATVKLRLPSQVGVGLGLVPGVVPPPSTSSALRHLIFQGLPWQYREDNPEVVFTHVPEGRVTVFFHTSDVPGQFHTEELDIPAGGTVSLTLQPSWRRLDVAEK